MITKMRNDNHWKIMLMIIITLSWFILKELIMFEFFIQIFWKSFSFSLSHSLNYSLAHFSLFHHDTFTIFSPNLILSLFLFFFASIFFLSLFASLSSLSSWFWSSNIYSHMDAQFIWLRLKASLRSIYSAPVKNINTEDCM